jgi:hypothetical protein
MSDIGFRLLGDNSNFRAMIDSSNNALTKFNGALGLLGTGLGTAAVVGFFKTVAERAGDLQDLSDRLGVSTDHLQAFDFAVRQAGGSSEQANQAWDKGRKALDNLAAGNEAAEKQFTAIGLSAKDFVGLDLPGALEKIAQGYVNNANSAGAYDAITDILGSKSAPALLAVINELGGNGFPALIEALDATGNKIESDTIRQLDALGDRVEAVKGRVMAWGSTLLGWVMNIGEGLGALVGNAVNVLQGLDVSNLEVSAKKATKAIAELEPQFAKLTAEGKKQILQELEKAKAEDEKLSKEKQLLFLKSDLLDIDDQLRKSGLKQQEIDGLRVMREVTVKDIKGVQKDLDADAKKHAERMEQMTAKEIEDKRELLTHAQQIAQLKQDEIGWVTLLKEKGLEETDRQRYQYELAQTRGTLREVEKEQVKEIADKTKATAEADAKRAEEYAKMSPLQVAQAEHARIGVEMADIQKGAVNGLTTAEIERLNVMNQQRNALQDQINLALRYTEVTRTGKGYDQQSDDSLEGVRQRLRSQLDNIKAMDFSRPGGVGGKGKLPEQYLLESELFNLNKEIKERDDVRDYASRFGEQKTRQRFGDTLTDKALRDWTDQQTATTTAVQDIQQRLALLFPKK